jgi:hypothetical protein
MVTAASFRKLALSLGGVEHPHFDRAAFRAGEKGRIFCTLAADGRSAMVKLDLDAHEGLLRAAPEIFFSFGGWSRNGATGVQLERVSPAQLQELMLEAVRAAEVKPRAAKQKPHKR